MKTKIWYKLVAGSVPDDYGDGLQCLVRFPEMLEGLKKSGYKEDRRVVELEFLASTRVIFKTPFGFVVDGMKVRRVQPLSEWFTHNPERRTAAVSFWPSCIHYIQEKTLELVQISASYGLWVLPLKELHQYINFGYLAQLFCPFIEGYGSVLCKDLKDLIWRHLAMNPTFLRLYFDLNQGSELKWRIIIKEF